MFDHIRPAWEVLESLIDDPDYFVKIGKVDDEIGIEFKGRDRRTAQERVESDAVLEYWVQQYVCKNPEKFGLTELEGPFETGPDFKATVSGFDEKVGIEVEVRCANYTKHGHHKDHGWDNVKVLIVLEEKEPTERARKNLPAIIKHVDKEHFRQWYEVAHREYAQKKEPANETNRIELKLHLIAGRIHHCWLEVCPHTHRDMATCPSCDCCPYFGVPGDASRAFSNLAIRFLQERGTKELRLSEIFEGEVDEFCERVFKGG